MGHDCTGEAPAARREARVDAIGRGIYLRFAGPKRFVAATLKGCTDAQDNAGAAARDAGPPM